MPDISTPFGNAYRTEDMCPFVGRPVTVGMRSFG